MILLEVPFAEKETAKSLGARWNPTEKKWYIPDDLLTEIDKFNRWLPNSNNQTQSLIGSVELSLERVAISANDKEVGIPLSSLMIRIQQAIKTSIADFIWVIAEVANINESRGHYYFELAETLEDGQQLASCRAMIWQSNTKVLEKFSSATVSEIAVGQKLLLLVEPTFHEKFGFSLVIQDIDPSYTLGELEAKVQAIRKQLINEKLYDKNKQFELPKEFFRLAVISPADAAGLGDFRADADLLVKEGLCEFKYFYSAFQGEKVEQEMQAAFSAFMSLHEANKFDALIIIRGGGAKLDLQPLNSYQLAKAIAQMNLPVMTGIGHERDITLLDEVSAVKFDTPSKVIAMILRVILASAQQAKQDWFYIEKYSQIFVQNQKQLISEINQTITQASKTIIQQQRQNIVPLIMKVEQQSAIALNNQKNNIKQLDNTVKLQITSQLKSQKEQLNHFNKTIISMPVSILERAKSQLKQLISFILSSGVDSQLNRGFAMVFDDNKKPLTTAKKTKQQQNFTIKFKDGVLKAKPN
jgi:exodeoxyribonuclease VII large subunit